MKKLLLILLIASWGFNVTADEIEPEKFIAQSLAGLQDVSNVHSQTWGFGSEETWGVDQDTGKISFYFADGKLAEAPVQIIGTYAPNGTFMWGWNHPSVQEPLSSDANLVRDFGEKYQLNKLLTQQVEISEQEAWEYTALAMRLSNANGAYRADAGGGTLVYMTFGEIKLSQQP